MDNSKPLVTLMVCTYNQEEYIRYAVLGALAQTYSPMEIILSDDCSTDNTFAIMQELASSYTGPNRIILNRNKKNLGLVDHVNLLFSMAKGELIIGSSGDDICLPNRSEVMVKHYIKHRNKPILFHGNVIKIGPNGEELGEMKTKWGKTNPIDLKRTAISNELYIGASSAFTRKLLDSFPPMQYREAYEDLVWGFRATLINAVVYVKEPLIKYRVDVGISWKLQELKSTTLPERLKREKRKALVFRDVLEQRLLDLNLIENAPNQSSVKKEINKKLTEIEIDLCLAENFRQSLRYLLSSPIVFLKRANHLRLLMRRSNSEKTH